MVRESSIRPPWTTTVPPSSHLRHRTPQRAIDWLSALPHELILEICHRLHDLRRVPPTSPLTALCRASRCLYAIGSPVLYHQVSHDVRTLRDLLALLNFSRTARKRDTVRLVRHLALRFQLDMAPRFTNYEAPFVDTMTRFLASYSGLAGLDAFHRDRRYEEKVDVMLLVLLHLIVPLLSGLRTLDADVGGSSILDMYFAQPATGARAVLAPQPGGSGSPMLLQVSVKTRDLPRWANESLTFFLRGLIRRAPNIRMLDARLLVPRDSIIVRSPTSYSSLGGITHLDLRGLGLSRVALEAMLRSCGRLVSFKFRMADGELSVSGAAFFTDVDVPAILSALRQRRGTLETLVLEVAEFAVHTRQIARQRMSSLRSFGALKHLSLDSYCYEETQPLGALLPASLETLDVVCLHPTMHEEMRSLAGSAGRARGLRSVTMYPWPNSDVQRTDVVEIAEIARLFRDRGVVFAFSHRMSLSPCENERRRFHDRLRQWDLRYLTMAV
ncbi:hypothetical protein CTA2_8138 [Colletotrichum tanaceti]|uniref:Uncharacterized protein n=1 Tax=Colletotrichum tanaceti TaxID=1306861 RepID=A0A4U6X0W1_9PEZI|nr:hypothetical protein CTA2_8138 [Colletotrichum tanaceti]TKW49008.1 hypothetical protein CTA1_11404 [Colletotrichum tanaceti]